MSGEHIQGKRERCLRTIDHDDEVEKYKIEEARNKANDGKDNTI